MSITATFFKNNLPFIFFSHVSCTPVWMDRCSLTVTVTIIQCFWFFQNSLFITNVHRICSKSRKSNLKSWGLKGCIFKTRKNSDFFLMGCSLIRIFVLSWDRTFQNCVLLKVGYTLVYDHANVSSWRHCRDSCLLQHWHIKPQKL